MRFLTRSLTGVFLMALTIGILAFAGGLLMASLRERAEREGGGRPAEERVLTVRAVTVDPQTATPVLEAFGELRARRELEVRAPAAGRIVALAPGFEEGGRVRAGERLVAIDPSDARTALDRARAETAEAEAERRDAERSLTLARDELAAARSQADLQARALDRAQSLAGRGVGTEAAIEAAEIAASAAEGAVLSRRQAVASAEARIDQAEARIARAAIDLSEAERGLADTELRAAFDGVLAEVAAIEGGLVSLNERLARLVDPDALEAEFRVSAVQYARLVDDGGALIGAPVEVSLGVSEMDIATRGTISRESADVGEGRTGRTLYARLDPAPGLRPGDFVRVSVAEPALERVARLPATALAADQTVLVLGEEGRLELAEVALMRRQGDDVLVRADDLAGREVVAERSPLLGPGIKVRPASPPPSDENARALVEPGEASGETEAAPTAAGAADEDARLEAEPEASPGARSSVAMATAEPGIGAAARAPRASAGRAGVSAGPASAAAGAAAFDDDAPATTASERAVEARRRRAAAPAVARGVRVVAPPSAPAGGRRAAPRPAAEAERRTLSGVQARFTPRLDKPALAVRRSETRADA